MGYEAFFLWLPWHINKGSFYTATFPDLFRAPIEQNGSTHTDDWCHQSSSQHTSFLGKLAHLMPYLLLSYSLLCFKVCVFYLQKRWNDDDDAVSTPTLNGNDVQRLFFHRRLKRLTDAARQVQPQTDQHQVEPDQQKSAQASFVRSIIISLMIISYDSSLVRMIYHYWVRSMTF